MEAAFIYSFHLDLVWQLSANVKIVFSSVVHTKNKHTQSHTHTRSRMPSIPLRVIHFRSYFNWMQMSAQAHPSNNNLHSRIIESIVCLFDKAAGILHRSSIERGKIFSIAIIIFSFSLHYPAERKSDFDHFFCCAAHSWLLFSNFKFQLCVMRNSWAPN